MYCLMLMVYLYHLKLIKQFNRNATVKVILSYCIPAYLHGIAVNKHQTCDNYLENKPPFLSLYKPQKV